MLCVQDKEEFKMIAVWLGMFVCLFVTGCRDKSSATDHYDRGEAHYLDGEYDQAFSELTKAIEIDPRLAHAYVIRGMAYKNKGEYDLAVGDYSKAIEIDPTIADPYRGRAGAYYYKGEYDQAWKDVHEAQALGHQVDSKLLEKLRKASGRDE